MQKLQVLLGELRRVDSLVNAFDNGLFEFFEVGGGTGFVKSGERKQEVDYLLTGNTSGGNPKGVSIGKPEIDRNAKTTAIAFEEDSFAIHCFLLISPPPPAKLKA